MTTIRSAIERASSWLCVTWMNISPSWRCRFRSSTRMRSCSSRSRSPSGSSSSSAFGFVTRTRARATRCCWPPESALRLAVGERLEPDHLERLHRRLPPLRLADPVHLEAELDVLRASSGAGRARSAGRRSWWAACAAAGRSATRRRAGSRPASGARARRSSAASSSSRSRTARAARRTRRGRHAG